MARPVSHWICLISLAFVMLFLAPEAGSTSIGLPCCLKSYKIRKPETIVKCFEQKDRHGCHHHAFVIMTESKMVCVNPTSKWLMKLIEMGDLQCPPDIARFEFLGED